jgi:glutaredoxin
VLSRFVCALVCCVLVTLAALMASAPALARSAPDAPVVIELFSRDGCPRCAAAKVFLEQLQRERPGVEVLVHDVVHDPESRDRMRRLAAEHGVAVPGVPAILVRDVFMIGFTSADTTGARLRAVVDAAPGASPAPLGNHEAGAACSDELEHECIEPPPSSPPPLADDEAIVLPLLGPISPRSLGLPLFTIVIGLLDGFNPCAMWVLLLLLSFLVTLQSRAKVLAVGGTFVIVSGIVYFAFMAAWLNIFLLIGLSRAVQVLLGAVAGVIGAINVKDFFAFKKGISLSIPESAKPGIYRRMRAIVQAEHLFGAVVTSVALAVLVNMVELLCTAGFPAVYTRILTLYKLPTWKYYSYLGLYNVAYVADDALMLGIAVTTLARRKLQEHEGRWLKLVSGAVMVALGVVLMVRPGLLAGR